MQLSHLARLVSLMAMLGHRLGSVTAYGLPLGLYARYIQARKVNLDMAINALVREYAIENASNHGVLLLVLDTSG
jgi:hypothetical protein